MPFKNIEDKKQYDKQYYQNNKSRLNAQKAKNEHCVQCNKWFQSGYLKKHFKTKTHANKVAELIKNKNS